MNAPLDLTLIPCVVLGFRYGFDYDYTAISDTTGVRKERSTAIKVYLNKEAKTK
jgi:hypothetical protein